MRENIHTNIRSGSIFIYRYMAQDFIWFDVTDTHTSLREHAWNSGVSLGGVDWRGGVSSSPLRNMKAYQFTCASCSIKAALFLYKNEQRRERDSVATTGSFFSSPFVDSCSLSFFALFPHSMLSTMVSSLEKELKRHARNYLNDEISRACLIMELLSLVTSLPVP